MANKNYFLYILAVVWIPAIVQNLTEVSKVLVWSGCKTGVSISKKCIWVRDQLSVCYTNFTHSLGLEWG